jgi:hydroxymethylglutaryl-CoA lyase
MTDLPARVTLHEEGPREGFQFEKTLFPLAERVRFVDMLSATGLSRIQVASFVSPRMVPQMADSAELFGAIAKPSGVRHTSLWLSEKGYRQAAETPGVDLSGLILLYASDAFSLRNNGCSADEMRRRQEDWIAMYDADGVDIEAIYIMTAFGCNLQGDIPFAALDANLDWIASRFAGRALPVIYLADTVGWAVPTSVTTRISFVRTRFPDARIGLHLHDTRGAAMASFLVALQLGVTQFDGSVAGLGGCPFAGHGHGAAAGNICTEDMVFMAHEMGIETGVDLEALIEAARMAEALIGRPLPGRVMHGGSLASYRNSTPTIGKRT